MWLPDGEPLATHSAAAREPEPDPANEREPQPEPEAEREPQPAPATERAPQPEPAAEPQSAQLGPDEPAPIEPDFAAAVRRAQPSQWLAEELPPVSSHSPATEDRPAPLHPERARAALRAYCRELLDPQVADEAVEMILSRFDSAAAHSPATLEELLRVTRKTVAGYALAPGGWQGLVQADPEAECRATPARLAARAGEALSAAGTAELECHLETCLRCQAIELRVTRAERAFATTLAARGEDDQGEWPARSSPIAIAQTAEQAGGEAPGPRRRGLFGNPKRFLVAGVVGALLALVTLLVLNDTRSPGGVQASAPLGTPSSTTAPVRHRRRSRRHRPVVHRRQTHRSVARRRAQGHAVSRPGSSTASGASVSSAVPVSPAPAPGAAVSPGSGSSGSGGSGGSSGSGGSGGGSGSAGSGGGSSGSGSSGSSVSVTQQGSGLPAQNAPTQGIGTGGSSGSAH